MQHEGTADEGLACTVDDLTGAYADLASRAWHVSESLYAREELASLPAPVVQASLGLGHPVRHASLQAGEVVLDIGCGAGIDVLLASPRVGAGGAIIGLDVTQEMLKLARAATSGLHNTRLLSGVMEHIPLGNDSVDVIISNGVFNLSSDKDRTFEEAHRVLRPGGRMVVADMLLVTDLPPAVLEDPKLWSG